MASVNVNFDLNVANSDDEKMPHEHQMDGLVPWEGWCLNKKKKIPFNFYDFKIDADGTITGNGQDERAHFKIEGKLDWFTNKKTKEQFPRALFEKKYSTGKNSTVCKGFIDNGVIKGEYNYGKNIQFGDFEMKTIDPDWFEIERRFNKKLDEKLKNEKTEWLSKLHAEKEERMRQQQAEKEAWEVEHPDEEFPESENHFIEPNVEIDYGLVDEAPEIIIEDYTNTDYSPHRYGGVYQIEDCSEVGGELQHNNSLEQKTDIGKPLQAEEAKFEKYIDARYKGINCILAVVGWIISLVLLLALLVIGFCVNFLRMESTGLQLGMKIGVLVCFLIQGLSVIFTKRWTQILEQLEHEKQEKELQEILQASPKKAEIA